MIAPAMDLASLNAVYPDLRRVHLALVAASGSLFALRGAAVLAGRRWPLAAPWRAASIAIDTLLLAAGATLWAVLRLDPLRDAWLGTKLALLVLYVVLGTLALRRARTPAGRLAAYGLALATFAAMVGVATAHHPLGFAAGLAGR